MSDYQALADRFEIFALQAEFTDAAMMRDNDRVASLFTHDAVYRIPVANIEMSGAEQIRAGTHRLDGVWEFFIQTAHPGTIQVDGDTASARAYVSELGRLNEGRSMFNHGLFHDRYRRTPDGWKFTERVFEVRYFDTTPLTGSPRVDVDLTKPAEANETSTQAAS
ncbi:nuclear transport factor 2 family protein [Actinopolymorpha sp. B11F2]|uniref:nuclear transport factor 2 family protein n=1 Tax=Actinopolymorpha sp. B11F2 TaxID=3160862 RepID=UPI0032E464FC